MNLRTITKNYVAGAKIGSPKNRFYSCWESQLRTHTGRPPDCLGVKYGMFLSNILEKINTSFYYAGKICRVISPVLNNLVSMKLPSSELVLLNNLLKPIKAHH